jgi:hypothetical protein
MVAVLGLATAWRFNLRRYVFLLLATIAQVAFGAAYKVEDYQVFFLPAFMFVGLWAASGFVVLLDMTHGYLAATAGRARMPAAVRPWLLGCATVCLGIVLLILPLERAVVAYPAQNRSRAWQIYDYGQDMLAHVAPGGQIIGLGGEISLVRYFRDVLGLRTDVQVVRADGEAARRQAVDAALAQGIPAYLTRDLPGAAARYSLDSAGPLIRVLPKAQPAPPAAGQPVGEGVILLKSEPEIRQTHEGPMLRLNLTWTTGTPITESLKVSARLLDTAGNLVAAQDRVPVSFTYPTTAWVPGEPVQDVYDLRKPPGSSQGPYRPVLILYRAGDGSEVGRVELPQVSFSR